MEVLIVILGGLTLFAGLLAYSVVVGAFVASIVWGWFITPLYGVPAPPLPLLAGLLLAIRYATYNASTPHKGHKTDMPTSIVTSLIYPWVVLLFAYLIHLWAGV